MTETSDRPGAPPASVAAAVLVPSNEMPENSQKVEELDFDKFSNGNMTVVDLVESMTNGGFQGSAIGEATKIINQMVCCLQPTFRFDFKTFLRSDRMLTIFSASMARSGNRCKDYHFLGLYQ